MSNARPAPRLVWRSARVGGRLVKYGSAGEGVPVLFVHGWGLGNRAYKSALNRLVQLGCRVYAPALPGFGGSTALPARGCGLDGYAAWVDDFLAAVGEEGPVVAVGHSFGAAVATKFAHDFPAAATHLVLINPLGGSVWKSTGTRTRVMVERPLWDWALSFPRDILLDRRALQTIACVAEDAAPNLVINPLGVLRAAGLARRLDLGSELSALRAAGLPVVAVWASGDAIIPRASFESLCEALDLDGRVVPGRHSWLLTDPALFAEVMADTVAAAASVRPHAVAEARAAG